MCGENDLEEGEEVVCEDGGGGWDDWGWGYEGVWWVVVEDCVVMVDLWFLIICIVKCLLLYGVIKFWLRIILMSIMYIIVLGCWRNMEMGKDMVICNKVWYFNGWFWRIIGF